MTQNGIKKFLQKFSNAPLTHALLDVLIGKLATATVLFCGWKCFEFCGEKAIIISDVLVYAINNVSN